MSFTRTFEGLWNRRIYDLIGSQGWTLMEGAIGLGFKSLLPINRILRGGKPSVKFLLNLRQQEKDHAGEIAEFVRQQRPFKRYIRERKRIARLRALEVTIRPSDIAEVGALETVGSDGQFGDDDSPNSPPKLVYWTDPRRYKRKNNQVGKP